MLVHLIMNCLLFVFQVDTVNQLARQLLQNEHPNADQVIGRQDQLTQKWEQLQNLQGEKRNQLNTAHGVSTWHIECQETMVSICHYLNILQLKTNLRNKT